MFGVNEKSRPALTWATHGHHHHQRDKLSPEVGADRPTEISVCFFEGDSPTATVVQHGSHVPW